MNWTSVYSTVSGHLPPESIPVIGPHGDAGPRIVRCELDVAAPGKVDLLTDGPVEKMWLDAELLSPAKKITGSTVTSKPIGTSMPRANPAKAMANAW
ncbi:MAG: hypothetical protein IH994_11165, partial [Proteobacteria bacterium]|nr:hypothetical protein [Pseudomonadota bacterium]